MRKLHYTLLILCFLCPQFVLAQRRYMTAERWEYRLQQVSGFTDKPVSDKTDAFWGLHTSQYVGSHHLIGFSLEGSWSSFLNTMPKASFVPGGWAAGLHLLYEYQYSGILFQTGLGVNYQRVYTNVADTAIYHYDMHDKWTGVKDVEFTLKHQFYERQDMSQMLYGQIPFYVGHYIIGNAGVGYYLLGVHLNYAFMGSTTQKLKGTTTGLYERYVGIWEEMDNHGFRKDVPVERHGKQLNLKLDVMAHAEIGYEYTSYQGPHNYRITATSSSDLRIRFAGFIDFGILDISPRTERPMYDIPTATIYDFPTYRMEHVFSTPDAQPYWMRNIYAGIRITFLYGFPGKEQCILCNSWRR